MASERTGILVLGHGTRYAQGRAVIRDTAARYQSQHPEFVVRHGFVEMAEPQLEAAVEEMIADGMTTIVVVPLFLSFGHHIAKDLPARMEKLETCHQDVNFITTAPIGADPLLCDIIQARVNAGFEKA